MLVIKLFTGLFKHFGIWAVGTAGENCLHGPDKHLKSRKELGMQGQGSMNFCIDINDNITAIRWVALFCWILLFLWHNKAFLSKGGVERTKKCWRWMSCYSKQIQFVYRWYSS